MKDYLLKKDITVKEFASRLGISASYLYQLIRGERKPSLNLSRKIEQCTNSEIKAKDLLGLDVQFATRSLTKGQDRQLVDLQESNQRLETQMKNLENRVSHLEGQFYRKSRRNKLALLKGT